MTAYYNERDPLKAAVLREAIKAKAIAYGDVDERSIEDVTAGDVRGYQQCHWFAGGGFWSLAFRRAGIPDWYPAWSGSCPCPSFSAAGKGGGFSDPRHLWPAWSRLISERKPPVVFGEQADDAVGYGWLDLVQTDLEKEAYAVGKAILGAASVGAPHIRQRLYFVGELEHTEGDGWKQWRAESGEWGIVGRCSTGELEESGYSSVRRRTGSRKTDGRRSSGEASGSGAADSLVYTGRRRQEDSHQQHRNGAQEKGKRETNFDGTGSAFSLMGTPASERCGEAGPSSEQPAQWDGDTSELGVMAHAERQRDDDSGRNEAISSPRTMQNKSQEWKRLRYDTRKRGPVNGFWRDAEWIPCRVPKVSGAVEWRAIERGTFALAARYPERVAELRLAGDAINVEIATAFCQAWVETRNERVA